LSGGGLVGYDLRLREIGGTLARLFPQDTNRRYFQEFAQNPKLAAISEGGMPYRWQGLASMLRGGHWDQWRQSIGRQYG
jgi:hypothetical protein